MYDHIADKYDFLMKDVDYGSYAAFFDALIKKYSETQPQIILDNGCGTGNLTVALRNLGYSMIGADASAEMLEIAIKKDATDIQYINQNMERLDLFGTVGAAVSFLDCINHITDKKKLIKGFNRVSLFTEPGGLFIFDVNTEYKFESMFAKSPYYDLDENISYVWENKYDKKTGLCTMYITVFEKNEDDMYERYDTVNVQRAYPDDFLIETAKNSGLKLVTITGDKKMRKPGVDCLRKFFVFRKIK